MFEDGAGGCGVVNQVGQFIDFVGVEKNGLSSVSFDTVFPSAFRFSPTAGTKCTDIRNDILGFNVARSVGPAIGGAIVAAAGAAAAFLANTLSYLGLIVVLFRWKPNPEPRVLPREGLFVAMSAGVRYVAMSPNLRRSIARGSVVLTAATGDAPRFISSVTR